MIINNHFVGQSAALLFLNVMLNKIGLHIVKKTMYFSNLADHDYSLTEEGKVKSNLIQLSFLES